MLPQQMEREMAVNRTTTISAESIGLINNTNDDEIGAFGFKTGAQIDGRFTQSKDDDSYNCLLQCSTNGFWQLRLSPQQNRTGTEFNLEPFTTVYVKATKEGKIKDIVIAVKSGHHGELLRVLNQKYGNPTFHSNSSPGDDSFPSAVWVLPHHHSVVLTDQFRDGTAFLFYKVEE